MSQIELEIETLDHTSDGIVARLSPYWKSVEPSIMLHTILNDAGHTHDHLPCFTFARFPKNNRLWPRNKLRVRRRVPPCWRRANKFQLGANYDAAHLILLARTEANRRKANI